jgi:hypothetical protein
MAPASSMLSPAANLKAGKGGKREKHAQNQDIE